jgi:hypothetical protein
MRHDKSNVQDKHKQTRDALLKQVAHAYDNAVSQLVVRDIDLIDDDELDAYAELLAEYNV